MYMHCVSKTGPIKLYPLLNTLLYIDNNYDCRYTWTYPHLLQDVFRST